MTRPSSSRSATEHDSWWGVTTLAASATVRADDRPSNRGAEASLARFEEDSSGWLADTLESYVHGPALAFGAGYRF